MGMTRLKALAALLATVEKRVHPIDTDRPCTSSYSTGLSRVSTGSLGLDLLLDGGYSSGGLIEICGPTESGKTTLALHAISGVQKKGGVVGFIDADHALDIDYAVKLGVRGKSLLLSRPNSGYQAFGILEGLVDSDCVDLVVLDSVAPLVLESDASYRTTDWPRYHQSRILVKVLRKLAMVLRKRKVVILFINSILGNKVSNRVVVGGYASMRLTVDRIGEWKKGNEVSGIRTKVAIIKDRPQVRCGSVEFDIVYGCGICRASEVLDLALASGVCVHEQGCFVIGDKRLAEHREKVKELLHKDPVLLARIEEGIYEFFRRYRT